VVVAGSKSAEVVASINSDSVGWRSVPKGSLVPLDRTAADIVAGLSTNKESFMSDHGI